MTACNEHPAVVDSNHISPAIKIVTKQQNGKISHVTKSKKMEEEKVNNKLSVSPNKVNRESSISLIRPLINGDISSSLTLSRKRIKNKHCTTERKGKEEDDDDINYGDKYGVDSEEKEHLKLDRLKPKYVKITRRIKKSPRKTHVFWKTIYPFSISDRFELKKVEIIGNKSSKNAVKRRGFLYLFVIEPNAVNTNNNFAIFTPHNISNELELKHIKFRIHYPEYAQCEIDRQNQKRIRYKKMSSNIKLQPLNKYEVNDNEWKWLLEFNQIMFEMLDRKLSHSSFCTQQIRKSFDTKNYLITPLVDNDDKINWKLIQNIVKHHYNRAKKSYHLKDLLLDLQYEKFDDVVLYQNGSYFVPLNAAKQRNIAYIKQLIDEYKDLNEMEQLLDDDENNHDFYQQIIEKLGNKNLSLLCLRFDSLNDFIKNITDSFSLIHRNSKNATIIEPKLDLMDIGRDGVFRAPFTTQFFYTMIKIPFILFQFERIFRVLHFIQSQQYKLRQKEENDKRDLFWIKVPFLTLSKIMFCETISVPNHDLFKQVGKEIVTLIYCTSSVLSLLSSSAANNMNMVKMTEKLMNESACKFRKHLSQNHIFDYLSPSLLFRKNEWKPPRFSSLHKYNDCNVVNDKVNKYISSLHKYNDCNVINGKVNKYISSLLYPNKYELKLSNRNLFSIQNDLFSSIWYYNYASVAMQYEETTIAQLFDDCHGLIEWMTIDQVLFLSPKRVQNIANNLNSTREELKISNEYALFQYHMSSKNTKPSDASLNIKINTDALENINKEIQCALCHFVRDIDYEFVYPSVAITVIDPFNHCNGAKKGTLSFEFLYDLGNIVLNLIITLSVASNKAKKYPFLLYKKCLTSRKYLSYQCKYHLLYKHIKNEKNKENNNELMAAFIVAIIGAIYFDSNLNSNPLNLCHVYRFIKRYLAEVVFEQRLENIIYLFSKKKHDDDYPPD